jgi:uncharacterized Zn-finger protein
MNDPSNALSHPATKPSPSPQPSQSTSVRPLPLYPVPTNPMLPIGTHTGAKPFICPYPGCQSAFSESSNFSKHVRTHKGEKAYPCEECGKAFKRSDQLSRHRKIHERKRAEEGEEEDEDS